MYEVEYHNQNMSRFLVRYSGWETHWLDSRPWIFGKDLARGKIVWNSWMGNLKANREPVVKGTLA